jgi:hypothetical protein
VPGLAVPAGEEQQPRLRLQAEAVALPGAGAALPVPRT